MAVARGANLALKFVLELAAVAAFVAWGASIGDGIVSIAVAAAAGVIAIALWGRFAAPKSGRRLPTPARVAFELGFFALACAAVLALGAPGLAAVLGVLVVVNAAALGLFGDWDA